MRFTGYISVQLEVIKDGTTTCGVLFMTLYFHEFCENCEIHENLICEIQ